MPGLSDIAPAVVSTEEIDIRGTKLTVRALKNRETAVLLKRFPVLAQQAAKMAVDEAAALISNIETAPAVIAAALGFLGDAETEALVEDRLSAEEQAKVLEAIMRLSNPQDPNNPLAEPTGGEPVSAGPGRVLDTNSLSPSTS